MKRLLALTLVLCMMCGVFTVVYATESASEVEVSTKNYTITKQVDSDNRIVRQYTKKAEVRSAEQTNMTFDEMRDVLVRMGKDEYAVATLTTEELERYIGANSIYSTTVYIRSSENGNVEYISEEKALAILKNKSRTTVSTEPAYRDSVMELVHIATDYDVASGKFLFETEARWLVVPGVRGNDVIGCSAQRMAVDDDSFEGFYNYKIKKYVGGTLQGTSNSGDVALSDFKDVSDGTFYGGGGYVNFPEDTITNTRSTYYSDFFVHFEMEGYVDEPTELINFTTCGSYDHLNVNVSLKPEITIGADSSGVVLLDTNLSHESRKSSFVVRYNPNDN